MEFNVLKRMRLSLSLTAAGFLEKKLPLFGEISTERHTEFIVVECFDLKYACELILFHAGGGAV